MSLDSGGGRSVCLWRCRLLSVPLGEQASGRRWDCSGLDHVVRRCIGTKWYGEVPGARSTRDGDTGIEDDSTNGLKQRYEIKKDEMICGNVKLKMGGYEEDLECILKMTWIQ